MAMLPPPSPIRSVPASAVANMFQKVQLLMVALSGSQPTWEDTRISAAKSNTVPPHHISKSRVSYQEMLHFIHPYSVALATWSCTGVI